MKKHPATPEIEMVPPDELVNRTVRYIRPGEEGKEESIIARIVTVTYYGSGRSYGIRWQHDEQIEEAECDGFELELV
jgi:hypothetical protein